MTAPTRARRRSPQPAARSPQPLTIPREERDAELTIDGRTVRLTNLGKIFWTESGITKGDLLQYYADVADALVPHLRDRAMVMKRYPDKNRFALETML